MNITPYTNNIGSLHAKRFGNRYHKKYVRLKNKTCVSPAPTLQQVTRGRQVLALKKFRNTTQALSYKQRGTTLQCLHYYTTKRIGTFPKLPASRNYLLLPYIPLSTTETLSRYKLTFTHSLASVSSLTEQP